MLYVLTRLLVFYNGDAGIQEIHFLPFIGSGAVVIFRAFHHFPVDQVLVSAVGHGAHGDKVPAGSHKGESIPDIFTDLLLCYIGASKKLDIQSAYL